MALGQQPLLLLVPALAPGRKEMRRREHRRKRNVIVELESFGNGWTSQPKSVELKR